MGFFDFIDNLMVPHVPEDPQVTVGSDGHLILTDIKFRQHVETFLCATAAAATGGGGAVTVYNWAEKRRLEEQEEAAALAELAKAA